MFSKKINPYARNVLTNFDDKVNAFFLNLFLIFVVLASFQQMVFVCGVTDMVRTDSVKVDFGDPPGIVGGKDKPEDADQEYYQVCS